MDRSWGRRLALVVAGLVVLALSFWMTLTVIDSGDESTDIALADVPLTNDDGSPRVGRPSTLQDLPRLTGFLFTTGWDDITGLNVVTLRAGPASPRNPALSLVATRGVGSHRLGFQFLGVPRGIPLNVTVWLKAPGGGRISVDFRDGQAAGAGPRNAGAAAFDVASATVVSATGNVRPTIERRPADWSRATFQARSEDGVLVLYLALLNAAGAMQFGGSGEQVIFGGIEISAS